MHEGNVRGFSMSRRRLMKWKRTETGKVNFCMEKALLNLIGSLRAWRSDKEVAKFFSAARHRFCGSVGGSVLK